MNLDKLDLQTERYIINRFISIPKLFDSLGIDYRINGNILCPFHDNLRTPAAHLYADEYGYRIWCFAEAKMYGSWNIYKTFMPNINTNQLALMIFNSLSEVDQKNLINDLGTETEQDILPYEQSLKDFKFHKINMSELLHSIANSYIDEA